MPLTKGFVRNAGTTALDTRLMDSARILSLASGAVRTGVLTAYGAFGDSTDIVVAGSGMNVNVKRADFVTSRSAADGAVVFTNTGTTAVLLDAAPAANSRIDTLWVKHNDDSDGNGDANATPVFGVSKGTAAASPTKPGIPTGALELATITVPAGATTTSSSGVVITNTFRWTAAVGAVVNYRTVAEMQADSGNVNPGQQGFIFRDSSLWERATGFGWRTILMPAFNRNFDLFYVGTISAGSDTTLGSFTLPSLPVAYRAIVSITGTGGGNSSVGGNFGISLNISGANVTATPGFNSRIGRYRPYFSLNEYATISRTIRIDVPANTASTVTAVADASATAALSIDVNAACYMSGEF